MIHPVPSLRLLSLALFFLLPPPALLATPAAPEKIPDHRRHGEWVSSSLGGGGYILNIVQCAAAPEVLYTHVDVGGVYRSDDRGLTWRSLTARWPVNENGLNIYDTAAVDVDPRNPDVVLAAVGTVWENPFGLLRSTDGGTTWSRVLSTQFYGNGYPRYGGNLFARDAANPDLLYVGTGGDGVFRSEDGGATWAPTGLQDKQLFITHVLADAQRPGRLWVSARESSPENLQHPLKGGLYRSEDAGASWTTLMHHGPLTPLELAQAPWDANTLLGIFGRSELRLSTDGGDSWQPFGEGSPFVHLDQRPHDNADDHTAAIAVGPDFWLAASRTGKFHRRGKDEPHWQRIRRLGLVETIEGRPWHGRAETTVDQGWIHFGSSLGFIWIDPAAPGRWLFTDWYGLYRTEDAGINWTLTVSGIESTCLHVLVQDPHVPDLIHAGFWDIGYVRSQNAGQIFDRDLSGPLNGNMKAISPSPAAPGMVYGTGDGRGGKPSWTANQIWVSEDGGLRWRRSEMLGLPDAESPARYNSIVADPRDPRRAYVTVSGRHENGGGLYLTDDGGESWRLLGQPIPSTDESFFRIGVAHQGPEIAALGDGTFLAASHDRRRLVKLGADGVWQDIPLPEASPPRSLVADPHEPSAVYLSFHDGGAWRSADSGLTWKKLHPGPSGRITVDQHQPGRIALGLKAGVVISHDQGESWLDASKDLPSRWYPVPVFSGERLAVGTNGHGVYFRPLPQASEASR